MRKLIQNKPEEKHIEEITDNKTSDRADAIISIDIGVKNLAIVIITNYKNKFEEINIKFNLINLNDYNYNSDSIIINRCFVISNIFKELSAKYNIQQVVIERQVIQNTVANRLLYSIITSALNYTDNIIIFNPLDKFIKLDIKYTTKNKSHKKLSIDLIKNFLYNIDNDTLITFNSFVKKDDLADALLQVLIVIAENNNKINELREMVI